VWRACRARPGSRAVLRNGLLYGFPNRLKIGYEEGRVKLPLRGTFRSDCRPGPDSLDFCVNSIDVDLTEHSQIDRTLLQPFRQYFRQLEISPQILPLIIEGDQLHATDREVLSVRTGVLSNPLVLGTTQNKVTDSPWPGDD